MTEVINDKLRLDNRQIVWKPNSIIVLFGKRLNITTLFAHKSEDGSGNSKTGKNPNRESKM